MHRYLQPGVEEGTPAVENLVQHLDVGGDEQDARTLETAVFEKFNPLLHGGVASASGRYSNKKKEVLSIAFVKKYIQYAKNRIHPVLTSGAADWIVNVYASLRNDDLASNQKRTSPLTARTLETLIRLATAHAKARLSSKVDERDAIAAEEILRFALFKEVLKPERRKRRKLNTGGTPGVDETDDDEEEEEDELLEGEDRAENGEIVTSSEARAARAAAKAKRLESDNAGPGSQASQGAGAPDDDDIDMDALDAELEMREEERQAQAQARQREEQGQEAAAVGSSTEPIAITPERLQLFRTRLNHSFSNKFAEDEFVILDTLLPDVNEGLENDQLFGSREGRAAIDRMHDANEVMFSEGVVYKV